MGLMNKLRKMLKSNTSAKPAQSSNWYHEHDLVYGLGQLIRYLEESPEAFKDYEASDARWRVDGLEPVYMNRTPLQCAQFHSQMLLYYPHLKAIMAHSIAHIDPKQRSPRMQKLLEAMLADVSDSRQRNQYAPTEVYTHVRR